MKKQEYRASVLSKLHHIDKVLTRIEPDPHKTYRPYFIIAKWLFDDLNYIYKMIGTVDGGNFDITASEIRNHCNQTYERITQKYPGIEL